MIFDPHITTDLWYEITKGTREIEQFGFHNDLQEMKEQLSVLCTV